MQECVQNSFEMLEMKPNEETDGYIVRFEKLLPPEVKKRYPMYRSGAFKWALFHPDGGMIWASRAVAATASRLESEGMPIF